MYINTVKLYFDGACQPTNPNGHLGMGYVIDYDGTITKGCLYRNPKDFDKTTNNMAEYMALYIGVKKVKELYKNFLLDVFGDSQLVIKQMLGEYKVSVDKAYYPYYLLCKEITADINIRYNWIPRERNNQADAMSVKALIDNGITITDFSRLK